MAHLAPAGCNSGEGGKIVLEPSPKIALQPYSAGKVSRVEFHLPHAARPKGPVARRHEGLAFVGFLVEFPGVEKVLPDSVETAGDRSDRRHIRIT